MNTEEKFIALTSRMRQIEQEIDAIDAQLDSTKHIWHDHIEICTVYVSEEQMQSIYDIMRH